MANSLNIIVPSITLYTDRLIVSPVCLNRLDEFHEYSMSTELYRHLEYEPFNTYIQSSDYLRLLISRSSTDLAQYWFLLDKNSENLIGTFGLHSLHRVRLSVEIGYGISPKYWGNGFFQEAATSITQYAFETLNIHRIVAKTSAKNIASIKALQRIGFNIEGRMIDFYRSQSDGKWFDALLLSKLKF